MLEYLQKSALFSGPKSKFLKYMLKSIKRQTKGVIKLLDFDLEASSE